ncbi:pro-neuregulin-2, membrane-bound isoform-like [Thunnus maccoyii]|uniref:pro-neuregulin-2, membrane-bound isoform-like n=1 Tax=Thunnus maccoyii TaxID=8240 RepID=UPI001C4B8BB3|nr:pro-neuregulin-2, membrane-bound isoform-like [Thunnus maccoyii]
MGTPSCFRDVVCPSDLVYSPAAGVTRSGSPDTASALPGPVLAVCSPPCSMADAGAWRTHQDGPRILQPPPPGLGPGSGPGPGPGPAPNRVWISLIAGINRSTASLGKTFLIFKLTTSQALLRSVPVAEEA